MRDAEKKRASHFVPHSRSEFEFIEHIRKRAFERPHPSSLIHHPSLVVGIGDDAAVIQQKPGRETAITVDLLVEEIDFKLNTTTPQLLGHKALAVSLSDIAAMGALPRYALLSLGVPGNIWRSNFVDGLYEGFFALAGRYRVTLIGGDVSRTPERVVIDSIVLGDVVRRSAVRRTGAHPGDHIFVTGSLGGASAGLRLLEQGARVGTRGRRASQHDAVQQLLLRQLRPEPRVAWGLALNKDRLATAMIDISDGLSSDLEHLCRESNVGALLELSRIPIDPSVIEIRERLGLDPTQLALHGGEDFELLFTIRPRDLKRLPRKIGGVPASYIGDVTDVAGEIRVAAGSQVRKLESGGFTHFSE